MPPALLLIVMTRWCFHTYKKAGPFKKVKNAAPERCGCSLTTRPDEALPAASVPINGSGYCSVLIDSFASKLFALVTVLRIPVARGACGQSARRLGALQDAGARFSASHEREASWSAAALRRCNLERNRTPKDLELADNNLK